MANGIVLRSPKMSDGKAVFNLIKSSPPLDLNSLYYYYVLCRDFAKSSIVAEQDGKIVGYISGFIKGKTRKKLFVWQVAVDSSQRGKGLASLMLNQLVTNMPPEVFDLETTISPSNIASQGVFKKFAKANKFKLEVSEFLSAEDLALEGEEAHEEEQLYTISLKKFQTGSNL